MHRHKHTRIHATHLNTKSKSVLKPRTCIQPRTSIRRQREHMWVCELLPDKHKKGEPRNRYSFSISAFLFFYHSPFPVPCLSEQNHYHYHGIRSSSNLPTHPRLIFSSLRLLLLPFASLRTLPNAELVKKEKKNLRFITSNVRSFLPFSHILFCSIRMYVHVYSVGQGHRAAQLFSLIPMWLWPSHLIYTLCIYIDGVTI